MNFNEATIARADKLGVLIEATQSIAGAGDTLDMLGAVREVELAAEQARRAIIIEARAEGTTWQSIADALGTSRQNVQQRYGSAESVSAIPAPPEGSHSDS